MGAGMSKLRGRKESADKGMSASTTVNAGQAKDERSVHEISGFRGGGR